MRKELKAVCVKFVAFVKNAYNNAMTQPNYNSRLVFLIHGVVASVGTLALVVAFIFVKDKTAYPSMVIALGGSGGVAALGRLMTKKGDTAASPGDAVTQPDQPTS